MLGVALGLLASAFARTEFQAVQFMPVIVLPQFFLCGLLVPVDQMAGWLQAISHLLPLTYAVEALQEVGRSPRRPARCGSTSPSWPAPPCSPSRWRRRPCGGGPAEQRRAALRRSGRRPGNPDTRDAVLAAARQAFAERGFDGATIRGIAAAAGVDPALVHHYFGSKDKLFLAAIEAPANPADLLPEVLAGGRDALGDNVVRHAAAASGTARCSPAALALVRSAVGNEWTAKLLREFLVSQVLRRVVGTLDMPTRRARGRGSLVASQLIGLVDRPATSSSWSRWRRRPPESLVAAIGPNVAAVPHRRRRACRSADSAPVEDLAQPRGERLRLPGLTELAPEEATVAPGEDGGLLAERLGDGGGGAPGEQALRLGAHRDHHPRRRRRQRRHVRAGRR